MLFCINITITTTRTHTEHIERVKSLLKSIKFIYAENIYKMYVRSTFCTIFVFKHFDLAHSVIYFNLTLN